MRVGINPMAEATLPPAPKIIAAMIAHLPNRKGYHAERFEVIEASIKSLRATSDIPLYIWDNGSDAKFRDWLTHTVKPQYLTLAPNIGKASARTAILRTFPLDTIVCYSDDDIEYSPGWLDAHLKLLEGFPGVGVVSGCPVRTAFRWGNESTLAWARANATLRTGRFIPEQWDYEFCQSIGRDYLEHLGNSGNEVDYVIEYQGLQAYATAHHMQFIGYAARLGVIGLWTDQAMRAEQTFDVTVDKLHLLRLTTIERYTRHLGNVLEKEAV